MMNPLNRLTAHPAAPDSPKADAARRELYFVVAATGVVCVYLVLCALGTLPVLGDGSQHYRRAVVYHETGFPLHRINHDPAYPPQGFATVRYYDAALWHLMLAVVWRVFGGPSLLIAQVYQAVFFFALMLFTYLVGRELYGRRAGLWAWALMITIPMNLLFGMIFYLEVPVLAFAGAAAYFILRRRHILAGLALAGMFLTKVPTAVMLGPPLLGAGLILMGHSWRSRLRRTGKAALVGLIVMLPDILWRMRHFNQALMIHDTAAAFDMELRYHAVAAVPTLTAIPFNMTDMTINIKMLGLAGCLAVVAGILLAGSDLARTMWRLARHWRAHGPRATLRSLADLCPPELLAAGAPLLFYVLGFVVLLRGAHDVRYFQPSMLFACVLTGGLLGRLHPFTWHGAKRRWGRLGAGLLVCSMLGQWAVVPPYVRASRRLPPEILTAYGWIRGHTPPRSRFLYLEANFVALTGRPFVWAAAVPHYLFEVPEEEQMRLLYYLGVQYIAIHPTRQCDTYKPRSEPTAYPRPWVRSLAPRPYLVRVYPPDDPETLEGRFLIYRIDPTKVPREWLKGLRLDEGNPYLPFVTPAGGPAPAPAGP